MRLIHLLHIDNRCFISYQIHNNCKYKVDGIISERGNTVTNKMIRPFSIKKDYLIRPLLMVMFSSVQFTSMKRPPC